MSIIVQKFGGSSVADTEKIFRVAKIITDTYSAGNSVVVVVSAQGDTTDDLIAKAAEISPNPSKREMDVLLSTGEQISMSLLAMAIEKLGFPVISLTGWQVGLQTDATHCFSKIRRVDKERLESEIGKKNIVIVAGFQGINRYDDITTLGRGGSDTSAVALAAAGIVLKRTARVLLLFGMCCRLQLITRNYSSPGTRIRPQYSHTISFLPRRISA